MLDGYHRDNCGVVRQTKPFVALRVYDQQYVKDRYDQYTTCEILSILRINHILACTGLRAPARILDFGYGNGAFLIAARNKGFEVYGYDITGYPLPEGVGNLHWSHPVDVVTFYDSIEHLPHCEQRTVLQTVRAQFLVISLPWFHDDLGDAWFKNWKHRWPDEHLSHFSPSSMCKLLWDHGFTLVHLGNVEDRIRKPVNHLPNILTAIFRR